MVKTTMEKYNRIDDATELLSKNVNGCRNQLDEKIDLTIALMKKYGSKIEVEELVEKYGNKTITIIYTHKENVGSAKWKDYRRMLDTVTIKDFKATKCYIKNEYDSVKIDNIIGFYVVK